MCDTRGNNRTYATVYPESGVSTDSLIAALKGEREITPNGKILQSVIRRGKSCKNVFAWVRENKQLPGRSHVIVYNNYISQSRGIFSATDLASILYTEIKKQSALDIDNYNKTGIAGKSIQWVIDNMEAMRNNNKYTDNKNEKSKEHLEVK